MTEENISQEFRLKNIHETRSYLIKEIKRKKMISKMHKKVCKTLNCIGQFLILPLELMDLFQFLLLLLWLVLQ